MALPTSERGPAPKPKAKTTSAPTTSYADDNRSLTASSPAEQSVTPAAMYEARWGVPQPISDPMDHRQAPAPVVPTSYADDNRTKPAQNQALARVLQGMTADDAPREGKGRRGSTYGQKPKTSYGDERRNQDILGKVLQGVSDAARAAHEGRAKPRRGTEINKEQVTSYGDERREYSPLGKVLPGVSDEARAVHEAKGRRGSPLGRQSADDRRQPSPLGKVLPGASAEARATHEGKGRRGSTYNRASGAPTGHPAANVKPQKTKKPVDDGRFIYDPGAVQDAREQLREALADRPDAFTLNLGPGGGAAGGMTVDEDVLDTTSTAVETARANLDQALRDQRKHALGYGEEGAGNFQNNAAGAEPLTLEKYQGMTNQQRAGVDFNGMLVEAAKKDRANQGKYDPSKAERFRYQKAVRDMFGKGGGAEGMYAPETMALLSKMGYQDKAADLNDFLGLKAALTSSDIAQLDPRSAKHWAPSAIVGPDTGHDAQADARGLNRTLSTGTQHMERTLAQGTRMLQDMQSSAALARNAEVEGFGGIANNRQIGLGFGPAKMVESEINPGEQVPADVNTFFQTRFEMMAAPDADAAGILNAMQKDVATGHGLTAEEFAMFKQYALIRVEQMKNYGVDVTKLKGSVLDEPDKKPAKTPVDDESQLSELEKLLNG